MGEMLVTMQETFAGIRVIKSFARETHQEKSFKRSNQLQFSQMMRLIRSMEAVGPLVETIAAIGVVWRCFTFTPRTSAPAGFWADHRKSSPHDPIKTLTRIHMLMQQSDRCDQRKSFILDSEPTVKSPTLSG